jgi:hypothetical protein
VQLPPGVVCVIGTRPNDTLRPLELLRPHAEYKLPPLSEGDFALILKRYGVDLSADLMHKFYAGMQANALYLDLAAQELAVSPNRDPAQLFECLTSDPDSVFSLSIDRLRLSQDLWNRVILPALGVLLVCKETISQAAVRRILDLDGHDYHANLERLRRAYSMRMTRPSARPGRT